LIAADTLRGKAALRNVEMHKHWTLFDCCRLLLTQDSEDCFVLLLLLLLLQQKQQQLLLLLLLLVCYDVSVGCRLLLTQDTEDCFVLVMDVVRQIVRAAHDHLDNERASATTGKVAAFTYTRVW